MGFPTGITIDFCEADYQTWTDQSQNNPRWDINWRESSGVGNTISWVEDPVTAGGRTVFKCLKTSITAGAAGRVGPTNNLDKLKHSEQSGVTLCRTLDEWVACRRWCYTQGGTGTWTGLLSLFHFLDASTNLLRFGIASNSGALGYILGTGSTVVLVPDVTVNTSQWYNLTIHYKKSSGATDGFVKAYLDDTLILDVGHNNTGTISNTGGGFYMDHQITGTVNLANAPINIYGSHFACFDPEYWNDPLFLNATPSRWMELATTPWAGINLGAVRHNEASVCYCQPPGAFKHSLMTSDVDVAVEYSTDSGLSGSTTTSYVTAAATDRWWKHVRLTGLIANTTYYYRFKVTDGVDVFDCPIRSFKTLPNNGRLKLGLTHCTDQAGSPFPYAGEWIREGVDFANHGGDYVYNDSSYSSTGPHSVVADFLREYTIPLHDFLLLKYLHQRHMVVQASDHDFAEDGVNNDVLGGYQKGYIDIYGVNAGGADGTAYAAASTCQNLYLSGDSVTVPTLWDAGREAWYKAIRAGMPNLQRFAATPPVNAWEDTEEFETFSPGGGLHLMWLGTREWQDWATSPGYPEAYNNSGNPCLMGSAFEQWFEDKIGDLPTLGAKLLIIFMDSVFSDVDTTDDNFQQQARAQRARMVATLATIAPDCKTVIVCGDRHWRHLLTGARFYVGGPVTGLTDSGESAILAEVLPGQGVKGVVGSGTYLDELANSTGVLFNDGDQVSRSPVEFARFGCVISVNALDKSLAAKFWAYDGTTSAPTSQNFQIGQSSGGRGSRGRERLLMGVR